MVTVGGGVGVEDAVEPVVTAHGSERTDCRWMSWRMRVVDFWEHAMWRE